MKLFAARRVGRFVIAGIAIALAPFSGFPQAPADSAGQEPHGQVIYSRSTDETGQTTTTNGAAVKEFAQNASEPVATDNERDALTFTNLDLDVHLRPAEQAIAVRALLTVRNDGKTPLKHIALEISSSLNWERIRLDGQDATFQVAMLNSDADHTGQLREAALTLATPLAPNAVAQLDVTYSGTIVKNAQRLVAVGAPDDVALHSDWDEISADFSGLRGFGNVAWYPVSSVPVILGDGARLFDEMGEHKLRLSGAQFRLRLAVEFPGGQAPTVAVINGHNCPLNITGANEEIAGVATAELPATKLGFEAPSLFVATRRQEQAANTELWIRPEDEASVPDWALAATTVSPFLEGWLGKTPRAQLTVLDLPDSDDAPFETGSLLATAVRPTKDGALEGVVAHALTHAWVASPQAWLNEGVASFMSTLWLEKTRGRAKALESLEAERQALALAEPESPGTSPGQPLGVAASPVYYRTKADYVFWMLRDLAGDAALSAALRGYESTADSSGTDLFAKLVEQATPGRDLKWFFADWVEADKGLPDLAIAKVVPVGAQAGNTLVGITITNSGYAAAEVPVTVSTQATSVTQRVMIPARGSVTPRILILGTPTSVQINDGTVPEVQASVHVTTLGGAGDSTPAGQGGTPQ
jgi:hypothetical protein